MTKENAKQFIPLVEALAAGKTIQFKPFSQDEWQTMTSISFSHPPERYRIKPEPLRLWVNEYPDNQFRVHRTLMSAQSAAEPNRIRCVELVEVQSTETPE